MVSRDDLQRRQRQRQQVEVVHPLLTSTSTSSALMLSQHLDSRIGCCDEDGRSSSMELNVANSIGDGVDVGSGRVSQVSNASSRSPRSNNSDLVRVGDGSPCSGAQPSVGDDGMATSIPSQVAGSAVHRSGTSDEDSGCILDDYSWVPPGVSADVVFRYMSALPEDRVPILGTRGERERLKQLLIQLPPQDCEARYCQPLSEFERNELQTFTEQRRLNNLDRAQVIVLSNDLKRVFFEKLHNSRSNNASEARDAVFTAICPWCKLEIEPNDVCVVASRCNFLLEKSSKQEVGENCGGALMALSTQVVPSQSVMSSSQMDQLFAHQPFADGGDGYLSADCKSSFTGGNFFHPSCFRCSRCKELLVDLIYFASGDDCQPFCGRHHAELLKPRCAACDELIFSDECTEAEGFTWHGEHFSCASCTKLLGGERYIIRQQKPYCCDCFETYFAEICATCNKRIGVDQEQICHNGLYWHALVDCFRCEGCRVSLLNRSFCPKFGAVYCSQDCYAVSSERLSENELRDSCQLMLNSMRDQRSPNQRSPAVSSEGDPLRPGGRSAGQSPAAVSASTSPMRLKNSPAANVLPANQTTPAMASVGVFDSSPTTSFPPDNQQHRVSLTTSAVHSQPMAQNPADLNSHKVTAELCYPQPYNYSPRRPHAATTNPSSPGNVGVPVTTPPQILVQGAAPVPPSTMSRSISYPVKFLEPVRQPLAKQLHVYHASPPLVRSQLLPQPRQPPFLRQAVPFASHSQLPTVVAGRQQAAPSTAFRPTLGRAHGVVAEEEKCSTCSSENEHSDGKASTCSTDSEDYVYEQALQRMRQVNAMSTPGVSWSIAGPSAEAGFAGGSPAHSSPHKSPHRLAGKSVHFAKNHKTYSPKDKDRCKVS